MHGGHRRTNTAGGFEKPSRPIHGVSSRPTHVKNAMSNPVDHSSGINFYKTDFNPSRGGHGNSHIEDQDVVIEEYPEIQEQNQLFGNQNLFHPGEFAESDEIVKEVNISHIDSDEDMETPPSTDNDPVKSPEDVRKKRESPGKRIPELFKKK